MEIPSNALIAVDLDGTLCYSEYWGTGNPIPKKSNIEIVNNLYRFGYHIVIYTSRHSSLRMKTEHWLQENDVRYHALVMGERKMGFDLLIDDKAINTRQFFDDGLWKNLIKGEIK